MSTVRTTNIANASSSTTNIVLDAFGNATFGGVIDGLSTPGVATGTGSSSGGTLAAATYYVRIVAFDSAGNTTSPGVESTGVTTTGSTSSIAYTWTAITGATGYQVYFSTTSGTYASGYFVTTTNSYTLTTTSGSFAQGLPASNTTGISLMPNQSFKRNRIINGNMVIDQRNAGASTTAGTTTYAIDRFFNYKDSGGTVTAQQSSVAPTGFLNSVLMTVTSAATATAAQQCAFSQRIEGFNTFDLMFGTASAATITLSFWVRSSLTGTYCAYFGNSGYNRSYVATYSINSANTWEYKTITLTGDTTGTWIGATNGIGLVVGWSLGSGSNFNTTAGSWQAGQFQQTSAQANWCGTASATFYITGVQLEVGSVATPYERQIYSDQLAQCQRYLPYFSAGMLFPAYSWATGNGDSQIPFPVATRIAPTGVTVSSASHFYWQGTTTQTCSSITFSAATSLNADVVLSFSGATAGQGGRLYGFSPSAYLYFTGCEL